jgi:hypothetical protein
MLTREQFFALKPELPRERVDLPELGDFVFVRAMTGAERGRFEMLHGKSGILDFYQRMTVFCACDDQGRRLFGDLDMAAVGEYPASVLQQIAVSAMKLNKLGEDAVEDARKNSASNPSGASPSASPASGVAPSGRPSNGSIPTSSPNGSHSTLNMGSPTPTA